MNEIEKFRQYLVETERKNSTILCHIDCLRRLLRDVPTFDLDSIRKYLLDLKAQGKKGSYLNRILNTVYVYAEFKGLEINIHNFKTIPSIKSTLSDKEIEDFLSLPRPNHYGDYEMYTIFFQILAYSGMRCGEVANLKTEDIDFGRGVFILEDTKTNTPRDVPINPKILQSLTDYVRKLPGEYVFAARNGLPLKKTSWNFHFFARIKRLGIKRKRLTPYSMRHSFVTRNLSNGADLFAIQDIVGHKSADTTANYYHLDLEKKKNTIKKDPLSRSNLPYYDRLKIYREEEKKLREGLALTPEEERQMLQDAFNLV